MADLTAAGFDNTNIPTLLPIMLITRMHTGTRFFAKVIKDAYKDQTHDLEKGGQIFYMNHCQPFLMPHIKKRFDVGITIITTERDDTLIEASWMRRYHHLGNDYDRSYLGQRECWKRWVLPRARFILSVDADDRVDRLERLGAYLGVELTTNWEPIR